MIRHKVERRSREHIAGRRLYVSTLAAMSTVTYLALQMCDTNTSLHLLLRFDSIIFSFRDHYLPFSTEDRHGGFLGSRESVLTTHLNHLGIA